MFRFQLGFVDPTWPDHMCVPEITFNRRAVLNDVGRGTSDQSRVSFVIVCDAYVM